MEVFTWIHCIHNKCFKAKLRKMMCKSQFSKGRFEGADLYGHVSMMCSLT